MDYKNILRSQLLSDININFLVNLILTNFKISKKAISKCVNIISGNLNKYLENINRYPQNNNELLEAIQYLNKKCYDDFTIYLSTKYPNINLYRNSVIEQDDFIPIERNETKLLDSLNYQPNVTNYLINQTTNPMNNLIDPMGNKSDNKSLNDYHLENEKIIILTEEEKNKLLEQYNIRSNKSTKTISDEFLTYLTNPLILQMFNMMSNQINQTNQNNQLSKKEPLKIDAILDEEQVKLLLKSTSKSNDNLNVNFSGENKDHLSDKLNEPKKEIDEKTNDNENFNQLIKSGELEEIAKFKNIKPTKINRDKPELDLSKGLTKEMLPLIDNRIKELMELKNEYLEKRDMEMVDKIDLEKRQIIEAVVVFKKDLEKTAKESSDKIKNISFSYSKKDGEDDNIEYLDLKFDPTDDYNDLKDITIKCKSDTKIIDITLVNYYLPFNGNNVTRFNNKFAIMFNNKSFRFIIPPAKYDIDSLLAYIKSQINFLDFAINENKIITIKNLLNMKFDLWITNDSIFSLLGFTDKSDSYKEKIFYSATKEYNMTSNEKCLFTLNGTTMEPLMMEFDKTIELNKSLRKSRSGVHIRQLTLSFVNEQGQYYDFIMPFRMCLRLTYLE